MTKRATVGERSAYLLFNRKKEAGNKHEGCEPQRHDWFEIFLTECLLADFEERVTRYSGNDETHSDGQRAFW